MSIYRVTIDIIFLFSYLVVVAIGCADDNTKVSTIIYPTGEDLHVYFSAINVFCGQYAMEIWKFLAGKSATRCYKITREHMYVSRRSRGTRCPRCTVHQPSILTDLKSVRTFWMLPVPRNDT